MRFEQLPEAQGDIGVLGCVFHRVIDGHPIKGDHGFARAQERFDLNRVVGQVAFRQGIHPVTMQARIQRVGHQHRVVDGRDLHTVAAQDFGVVFDVLADFEDRRVL